jgi:hypothetical protein
MDGLELHETILREVSSGGPPYEVEVYYDGDGEMFFKGGWPRFAEDYDLHQGWFLLLNYHHGTAKFDVNSLMRLSVRRNMKQKYIFTRINYL